MGQNFQQSNVGMVPVFPFSIQPPQLSLPLFAPIQPLQQPVLPVLNVIFSFELFFIFILLY